LWSQAFAAEKAEVSERTYMRWELGTQMPRGYNLNLLCKVFEMSPRNLGYTDDGQLLDEVSIDTDSRDISMPTQRLSGNQSSSVIVLTREQASHLSSILIGDATMAHFDESRRKALLQLLGATGLTLATPISELINPEPWDRLSRGLAKPAYVNEEALAHFSKLTETCWGLSNASQVETVQEILPTYLPKVETIAQMSSKNQKIAAGIAAQGYMLAAEVDKRDVSALERYCDLAVQYSQLAGDYSIQVAALKQQATMALVAKKTDKALQIYQRALPLVRYVSPLLRSRIYMGLASAYARCGNQQDALRYIARAHETFPSDPESDPSFSYTVCTEAVLHLYDGLAYMDLDQPQQAWDALANVEGLNPKLHVAESWRIEIINLQASAAAELGDLERSCTYVEAGAHAAAMQGYEIWGSESADVFKQIQLHWPNEVRVKTLAEMFQPGL
jgi:tetratricopeptide (TPR) repeat protein/DNA-binding XRE family transcriptional regulator